MKAFIVLGILAASFAAAIGRGAPGAAETKPSAQRQQQLRQARQAVIDQKLELTAAQKAQARQLRQAAAATAKAVRENATLTLEQRRTQLAEAARTAQAQWRATLTPAQQEKLAALQAQPRVLERLTQQRIRAMALTRQLGLSPEQRTKIHALRQEGFAAARQVRGEAGLTPAQRQAKLREVAQANHRQIQQVLTPAQRAKLAQIRQRLLAVLGPLG